MRSAAGGQLSAGPRHCALIGRQHPQKTPTLERKDDACGTGLQAVCTEIGVGVCRNRNERAKAEGDWLVFVEANVTREKSEVVDLCVAEPSTRSSFRRRVCDDRRVGVEDLLNAVDLEGDQNPTFTILGIAAQIVQGRRVEIPVFHSKFRLDGIVSRVGILPVGIEAGVCLVGRRSVICRVRDCAGS